MKADLVIFGEDWGRHPSSTQHLARRLAYGRRTVWINSVGMRRPRLTRRDLARAANKLASIAVGHRDKGMSQEVSLPTGLTVVCPTAVSWPGSRTAFAANQLMLASQIRRHMHQCGIARPILWSSLPTALPAVGRLGERAVVYYCGDDFGALAGVDHQPVLEMEKRLVERADLVIAASEQLAARFPHQKTLLLPHGADVALFAKPAARPTVLPSGTRVAGFYGSISDWVDIDLLAAVADKLPDWLIVLVGSIQRDVSTLASRSNVKFIPARPHAELPGFVQNWTVSLMPFVDCDQIRACNPLKLREYLAAGTPIAATEFPALSPYRRLIEIGCGADGYANAIARAAVDHHRNRDRSAAVSCETWERRAGEVEDALAAL
jgi:glycosyltransferase involved in cell wall biosynthesis